jgi:DNA mismatch repair ATPase MutS
MGGKSTILRQTCLLAIIAQIGCLVPAKIYRGKVFDQIFCRIGASDNIN